MTPCELFAEIADRITTVVKQPYREGPVTEQEWDAIRDSILMLKVIEKEADSGARN